MGRSRSRSPDRRKRDRSRDRDRDRERDRDRDRARKPKKSRRRSESPAEAKLGSILRKRPSPSLKDTPRTLEDDLSNTNFDISKISSTARIWLEERVEEQIISRVEKVERVLNERFLKQKSELEQALRMQIEGEMKEEMERIRKDGEERQKRCEDLERDWKAKIASAEKKEKEYTEERLAMLQERSQLERERRKLEQERDVLKRSEQQTILNKGGGSRAPIRFTFGAK